MAPLANLTDIFLNNQAEFYNNFNKDVVIHRRITFICENPSFKLAYPSNELPFNNDATFQDVYDLILTKYPATRNLRMFFKFIDAHGGSVNLKMSDHLVDYLKATNTIIVGISNEMIVNSSAIIPSELADTPGAN